MLIRMTATKARLQLSRKVLLYSSLVLACLIVTHLILQFLNLNVFSEQNVHIFELSNRFDFDDESSIPTWFSQALFLCIGLVSLFVRHHTTEKTERVLWLIIGVLGITFSIDEIAVLHETVLQSIHLLFLEEGTMSARSNAWFFVTPFIVLGLAVLTIKIASLLPRKILVFIGGGFTLIVFGAIAVDIIVVEFESTSFFRQGVLVALEESMELFGAILVLYGVINYLEEMHPQVLHNCFQRIPVAKK